MTLGTTTMPRWYLTNHKSNGVLNFILFLKYYTEEICST